MTLSKLIRITLIIFCLAGTVSAFDTLKVEATLDTLRKEITGSVTYRLPSLPTMKAIEFQLFPNVYASEDSPYLKHAPNLLDNLRRSKKWGGLDIDSILLDKVNATSGLKVDYTRGRLVLPDSAGPAGRVVQIFFKTRIPELGDRLSYFRGNYLLDGWFPSPAILNNDGTWYNPTYSGFCELVGEYFQYEVNFAAPKGLVVVAALPPQSTADSGSFINYRYTLGPVHDFALVATGDYLTDSLAVGSTVFRFFYRPSEEPALASIIEASRKTYEYMSRQVGEYKYRYLTIALVDFAFMGGVELPGLICLSSPRGAMSFSNLYQSVVIHEVAHQWFYGMLGSNQIETPWMDESIAGLFTEKILGAEWGKEGNLIRFAGFKATNGDFTRASQWSYGSGAGIVNRPAYSFVASQDYFGTIYSKGALAAETFDNLLGDSLSSLFWREYFKRFLFKHPGNEDFLATAGEIGGEKIGRVMQILLNSSEEIDYSISALSNRPADSVETEVRLTLRKKGNLEYPVEYAIILANGDTLRGSWESPFGAEDVVRTLPSPAVEAMIDPDFKFAIDNNLMNNSFLVRPDSRAGMRLSSGMMFLLESLLSFLGGW